LYVSATRCIIKTENAKSNHLMVSVEQTESVGLRATALIVAHPGHELRVFRWMEEFRPIYCCITEGSGGIGTPRIASTGALLDKVGVTRGPIYGRYSDKEVYQLLLSGNVEAFAQLAIELADFLVSAGVNCVVGDAVEGFNPVHDVCRFLIDGAVERVRRRTGRVLQNYDFVLDGKPDACPDSLRSGVTRLDLDEDALDRKIAAAFAYRELRQEVDLALGRFGRGAFGVEYLRPTTTRMMLEQFDRELPAYERYGQMRVNERRYDEIIRYRQHVLPVRQAIEQVN
jgi:AcrR family transcriptional regulator